MKLNNKGIAHLLVLVAILVVGAIGFVGWKVFQANRNSVKSLNSSESTTELTEEMKIENTSQALLKEIDADTTADSSFEDTYDAEEKSDTSLVKSDDLNNVGEITDEINQ